MTEKTQKKILFITSSIPESESDWKSVFIGDMFKAFSKNGLGIKYWGPSSELIPNDVSIISTDDNKWLDEMMKNGGIANITRRGGLLQKVKFITKMLWSIRTTAVQSTKEFDAYFVNWLQNSISLPADDKPLIVTALGTDVDFLKYFLVRYMLRRIFKKHTSIILFNGRWMYDILNHYFGDVAKLKFSPLGIRPVWFEQNQRTATDWISVSRITSSKVKLLFDWGKLVFTKENKLILVGPNQENITTPSWVKAVGSASLEALRTKWYPRAKALIFLSKHAEGRPQTIIEAMASGVPVICLNKPLYKEFIISGENGYLVSNISELKNAMSMLSDEEHNQQISRNASEYINKNIGTWDDYSNNTLGILEKL